jgi:ketosteroid isomerase-like protein
MIESEKSRQELLALEQRYWKAIKDRDIEMALSLTDNPCIVAGARGVATVSREAFEDIMKSATYTLHGFKLKDDAQVRFLTDDIALLAYNVYEELTVDGRPVTIDASDTSIWVRRGNGWRCAMHSEALHGDPYGRDRIPKH